MQIIGHRGASGYVTENTMESFDRAVELGCDMIELDVHVCKSGELAVFHDFSLKKLTGFDKEISSMVKSEIRELNLPQNHKIPFLDEVLEKLSTRVVINIELKGAATSLPVCKMLEQFKSEGKLNKIPMISSLQVNELVNFRKKSKDYPLGWVVEHLDENTVKKALELELTSLHPSLSIVTSDLVSECHEKGIKIFVFTVNERSDFDRLANWAVDGIFTDYPDRFI